MKKKKKILIGSFSRLRVKKKKLPKEARKTEEKKLRVNEFLGNLSVQK